jgi:hypothetical protein
VGSPCDITSKLNEDKDFSIPKTRETCAVIAGTLPARSALVPEKSSFQQLKMLVAPLGLCHTTHMARQTPNWILPAAELPKTSLS